MFPGQDVGRFILFFSLSSFVCCALWGQGSTLSGRLLSSEGAGVPLANVVLLGQERGVVSDGEGRYRFEDLEAGEYQLQVSFVGYQTYRQRLSLALGEHKVLDVVLVSSQELEDVVVTGTMKEVKRSESPVPVSTYKAMFFKKNPTPTLFENLTNVNGVRPQLNCSVCNTGDVHINGLEGPYTMVLLDGMPIVSGLATVYGLSSIPSGMIQRVEVVKGPASSLYGSEAVAGLINVITKGPNEAPRLSADVMGTSWRELNSDLGFKTVLKDDISALTGLHLFNYSLPIDNNGDGFTDITLSERVSVFQKWNFPTYYGRQALLSGRYFYEDRWGGEKGWQPHMRGGDEVYGENIQTRRWEMMSQVPLPLRENMYVSLSLNDHRQEAYYGDVPFFSTQRIAFAQLVWDKQVALRHDVLMGLANRYTYYDDNTPATVRQDHTWLPGVFLQDDVRLAEKHRLLLGFRYDYHRGHKHIYTPRMAYKWRLPYAQVLRLNAGTGFRVVNLFTEDHAALIGAREVVIEERLEPERSYNASLDWSKKFTLSYRHFVGLNANTWYTHFSNQILPDYETDIQKIIYNNLDGYAVSRGVSLDANFQVVPLFDLSLGGSYFDVFAEEEGERMRPLLTERWTGTWALTHRIRRLSLVLDYTGNLYGPMRLPLLGETDPRDPMSPWWSIQNVQLTWVKDGSWEIYGGVKNLLNFTPPSNSIARSQDPFDREVVFDTSGEPMVSPNNPHALVFDPTYVFAPNQGIRPFLGLRLKVQ